MPIVYNRNGILQNVYRFVSMSGGMPHDLSEVWTTVGQIPRLMWKDVDTSVKLMYIYEDIPNTSSDHITIYFNRPGMYRVSIFGGGGNGGAGGDTWGLYDGGGGGGGGTGGLIALRADFTHGCTAYLDICADKDGTYSTHNRPLICRFIDYDHTKVHPVWFVDNGYDGGAGNDAGAFRPQPGGGAGGTGGRVSYTLEGVTTDYTYLDDYCRGYTGNVGGKGYSEVNPGEREGEGDAATPPPNISLFDGLATSNPTELQRLTNDYQQPEGFTVASTWTHCDAYTGYTVDHICLGNAGAGGWKTISYGDIPAGQGAQGGVVIEMI